MRDRPIVPALALVLAILAVATVAAGMSVSGGAGQGADSAEGAGVGEGTGFGVGEGDDAGFSLSQSEVETSAVPSVFWTLLTAVVLLTLAATLVAIVVVVWREGLEVIVEILRSTLTYVLGTAALVVAILALVRLFEAIEGDGGGGFLGGGTVAESLFDQGGSATTSPAVDPPMALLAVGGLVLAAVIALMTTDESPSLDDALDGEDAQPEPPDGSTVSLPFDSAFADVAPTNPVYRSWMALADAVDGTDRRTSTPGEVASAAIADGFDPAAVRTVTELFAEVRYGRRPVDDDRAARAQAAREVIEDQRESAQLEHDGQAEPAN